MKRRTFSLFLIISCLAILLILLEYAPHYLLYADAPVKSDAIVLFVGQDNRARQEEANLLITQGYARYFLIPAYGKIQDILGHDPISPEIGIVSPDVLKTKSYFESTHVEVLEAKRMMERLGISSAILVSSPYHMRRIRIIADYVFTPGSFPPFVKEGQGGFKLYTVPTRHETSGETFWLFNNHERKFVLTEYMKIGWFLLYSPFV